MHLHPNTACPVPLVVLCPPEHFERGTAARPPSRHRRSQATLPHAVGRPIAARVSGVRVARPRVCLSLVDESGKTLDPRLADVLTTLADRFRRAFPAYRDDETLADALEAAARKIQRRERTRGRIEQLDRYAWTTLSHVAISAARLTRKRLVARTLPSEAGAIALSTLPARTGTAEQIEARILLAEVLRHLTPQELAMCSHRAAGHTSPEIAARLRMTPGAIDVAFVRLRRKLRSLLGPSSGGSNAQSVASPSSDRVCRSTAVKPAIPKHH